MDVLTKKQRSYCMSRIKSKNTNLEIFFRKYIWGKGLRGYLVKNQIQGKPDLYFPKKKIAVFIDGCFWHKCPKCFIADKEINRLLKTNGIKVIRFWEHEIRKNPSKCFKKIKIYYEKK